MVDTVTCVCGTQLPMPAASREAPLECPRCHARVPLPAASAVSAREPLPVTVPPTGELVFRALNSIEWPRLCVGCSAPSPAQRLKVNVMAATGHGKATTGARVGKQFGGLVGAVVGGAVTAVATGAWRESAEYYLPICPSCRDRLTPREIASLESDPDEVTVRTTTRLLTRELAKPFVLLTFANSDYAHAFRAANAAVVKDSIAAHIAAEQEAAEKKAADSEAAKAASVKKCPRCEQPQEPGAMVCPQCGHTEVGPLVMLAVFGVLLFGGMVASLVYIETGWLSYTLASVAGLLWLVIVGGLIDTFFKARKHVKREQS